MSLDVHLTVGTCEHCKQGEEVFWANITHNLAGMASEAGVYGILWRPEENGIETASQLIEPLTKAIAEMEADPERFKAHNAPNGWGMYENFLPWLKEYLRACNESPTAFVEASR